MKGIFSWEENDESNVAKIVSSILATMSDQG